MARILPLIAGKWVTNKEGICLKYGNNNSLLVGKLFIQDSFYIMDLASTTNDKDGFMYSVSKARSYSLSDGIVVQRIYSGWLNNLIKI